MKLLARYTSSAQPNYGSVCRKPIVVEDEDEKEAIVSSKRYCLTIQYFNTIHYTLISLRKLLFHITINILFIRVRAMKFKSVWRERTR
jgi:hypothetical protein